MEKWAKNYLSRIRWKNIRIKQLESQLDKVKDLQGRTQAFRYDADKVQTSFHDYAGVTRAIDIMEIEAQIEKELSEMIIMERNITNQINALDNLDHRELLTLVYCRFKTLGEVAKEMNFSLDWVKHLHVMALKAFEDRFNYLERKETK